MKNNKEREKEMIIDKKGKVFGKINIIDLLVLLLIIGIGVFFGLRMNSSGSQSGGKQTIVMKYYIEEVNDFVINRVKVGDALLDDGRNVSLGKVTDVEIMPSVSWGMTDEGEYKKSEREGFYSAIITGEVEGTIYKNGAIINASKYAVGHTFVLKAGDAKLYLRVYDISVKE